MWEVKLKGKDQDLETMARIFATGHIQVRKDNDTYYLYSEQFSTIKDENILQETSEELVEFINTAVYIRSNLQTSIKPAAYCRVLPNGTREVAFYPYGDVIFPLHISVAGQPDSLPENWYGLWQKDTFIREVFSLFAKPHHDWYSLFKVYESIRDDDELGGKGKDKIREWGGIEKDKLFYKTANWERHSKVGKSIKGKKNTPPQIPMNLGEAFNFIRHILNEWLSWKHDRQRLSTSSDSE